MGNSTGKKVIHGAVVLSSFAALFPFGSAGGVADWKAVMPQVFSGAAEFHEVSLGETAPGGAHLYVTWKQSATVGYGMELKTAPLSGPKRLLVMRDYKHRIKYVYVLSYPYKHGGKVRNRKFLKQFDNIWPQRKTPESK